MERGKIVGVVLVIAVVIILSVSLVSASWFSDFWNKITGKTITGNIVGCPNCPSYCTSLPGNTFECIPDTANIEDTWVQSNYPSTNFGSDSTNIYSGWDNGRIYTTYLKFNIDNLPSNVQSVKLKLYYDDMRMTDNTYTVYSVSSNWVESSITYANAPTIVSAINSVSLPVGGKAYYSWDITSLYNQWKAGNNYGLAIKATENVNSRARARPSEYAGTTYDPKLEITYTTTCTEDWSCTAWSSCVNSVQTRTCTDANNCGTTTNKPATSQACTSCTDECTPEGKMECDGASAHKICGRDYDSDSCLEWSGKLLCGDSQTCNSAGQCVSSTGSTCIDSDGGIDYSVKGTCTDEGVVNPIYADTITDTPSSTTDSCYTSATCENCLIELSCSEQFWMCVLDGGVATCPDGTICADGACVSAACTSDADCPEDSTEQYCDGDAACTGTTSYSCQSNVCVTESSTGACGGCPNGCENGACIESSIVDGCDLLTTEDMLDIVEAQQRAAGQGKEIIYTEGQEVDYGDYVVVLGSDKVHILKVSEISNQTTGFYQDQVKFTDVLSADVYTATITRESYGSLTIGGLVYGVQYYGSSDIPQDERYVTLDYPQTVWPDIIIFNCAISNETQVCQDLIDNPIISEQIGNYELIYNSTIHYDEDYIIDYFNGGITIIRLQYEDMENRKDMYISIIVLDNKTSLIKNSPWIRELKEYGMWSVGNNNDNGEQYYIIGSSIAIWYNKNVLVWLGEDNNNEQPVLDIQEFINDLKSNEFKSIQITFSSEFYEFINNYITLCSSSVSESCWPQWETKIEPIICPPHGYQTQITRDRYSCSHKTFEWTQDCSPGMCSGCMVPRWMGYDTGNNVCIPYGTRLANQESHEGEEIAEGSFGDGELIIESAEHATLIIYGTEENYTYELYLGETTDLQDPEWTDENVRIRVDEIIVDETGGGNGYVVFTAIRNFDAYCSYEGRVYAQRKAYSGGAAPCQNNYECYSNLCSGGKCVEINKLINESQGIKSLLVRVLCKLAHLFNQDNYSTCVINFLGEEYLISGGGGPPQVSA